MRSFRPPSLLHQIIVCLLIFLVSFVYILSLVYYIRTTHSRITLHFGVNDVDVGLWLCRKSKKFTLHYCCWFLILLRISMFCLFNAVYFFYMYVLFCVMLFKLSNIYKSCVCEVLYVECSIDNSMKYRFRMFCKT